MALEQDMRAEAENLDTTPSAVVQEAKRLLRAGAEQIERLTAERAALRAVALQWQRKPERAKRECGTDLLRLLDK